MRSLYFLSAERGVVAQIPNYLQSMSIVKTVASHDDFCGTTGARRLRRFSV
jgi:hypothetical protein